MLGRAKRWAKRSLGPAVRAWMRGAGTLSPSAWGLAADADGHLCAGGVRLSDLLERWGSPLHVVFAERLRENARAFLDSGRGGAVRAEVFYSYKSNPILGVLDELHAQGVGAEAISEYELWLALELGVPPERIILNGPVKSDAAIRTAVERDVLLLNVNHREEIARVAAAARAVGRRPRVGVRVGTSMGWAGQFGVPVATGAALEAVREAHGTGVLDVCALHSHVGGMVRTRDEVVAHADEVLALADAVHRELGIAVRFLDFGGSLATPTVASISSRQRRLNTAFHVDLPPPDPSATIAIRDYVAVLEERVEEHFRGTGRAAPRLLLEPGRAMTGNTQVLLARVTDVKEAEEGPAWALLDAGINVAESMRSEYHHVFAATRMHAPGERRYRLAGPICSPGDVLRWSIALPALSPGDVLAFMDAGAYFVPFSTSFSFPQPAIVLLDGRGERLLRRAESFRDLLALDVPGESFLEARRKVHAAPARRSAGGAA